MKKNNELLDDILMAEIMELRTQHPSQCICVKCQGEKYAYVQRVIPMILKSFKRK